MNFTTNRLKGFSLIEVILVAALSTLVFGVLLASVQYSLELVSNSKAKLSALSLANDRMEYFRSLPYSEVGTVSGIPPGTIAQNSTTTLNGIDFSERVLVEYVDDPADGLLTATSTDSNGIPADYKRIKIEISWTSRGGNTNRISLISNIVPRSIETTDGGGTVRVNVIDADSNFLPGAEVTLVNNTTTSTISVTRLSDSSGVALFSGAPAANNYQVFVTAPGYSQDQTYVATTSNPNPTTAPFSVLAADISTVTFQIGELSDLAITTFSSIIDDSIVEDFSSVAGVASSSNTVVSGGSLKLPETAGVYTALGSVYLNTITPTPLVQYEAITVAASVPVNTSYVVQLFTLGTSTYTLIPDSDLPGNSTGYSDAIIGISSLDAGAYPSITVGISLQTGDTSVTPEVDEIALYYRSAETRRSGTVLSVQGNKTIGTDASSQPIYKFDDIITTDGSGEYLYSDIEFDAYSVESSSLVAARACPAMPLLHRAGIDSDIELMLLNVGLHSLRVSVVNAAGQAIPGAMVTLDLAGTADTLETNACGQSFFSSGIGPATDYIITVAKSGYLTQVINPYEISGNNSTIVILSES